MRFIKPYVLQITKHYDFIILDILVLILSYWITCMFRRGLDLELTHGELFFRYGVILVAIFFITGILSKNYKMILQRALLWEIKYVLKQTIVTWAVFTAVLFLVVEGHEYSRMLYILSFFISTILLIIERVLWKIFLFSSTARALKTHRAVIVADSEHLNETIAESLPASYSKLFQICGAINTGNQLVENNYNIPTISSADNISDFLKQVKATEVIIAISDAKEEEKYINMFIISGRMVYRSLGKSNLQYADEEIQKIGDRYYIAISEGRIPVIERLQSRIFERKRNRG